jgi:hypothetical protein
MSANRETRSNAANPSSSTGGAMKRSAWSRALC